MTQQRHVVVCVWSGYRSSQSLVCHRTVSKMRANYKHLEKVREVRFTDGTSMSISVRPCWKRERVAEIHGYDELLARIVFDGLTGSVSVLDVSKSRMSGRLL